MKIPGGSSIIIPVIAIIFTLTGCVSGDSQQADRNAENTQSDAGTAQSNGNSMYKDVAQTKVDDLNRRVQAEGINSKEAIMRLYAPEDEYAEGNYSYQMEISDLSDSSSMIRLIEDGRMDDSQSGLQVLMVIKTDGGKLVVASIRESYKCWPGRGHEDWGATYCN